jgi:ATP-dependent Clp protease ATP-binding subunit ClpB
LVAAAVLADRYISDRFLPDKAIDLVDEAAAKLKMEMTSKPTTLHEIDQSVLKLENGATFCSARYRSGFV